jgi:hypothetical protein
MSTLIDEFIQTLAGICGIAIPPLDGWPVALELPSTNQTGADRRVSSLKAGPWMDRGLLESCRN